MFLKTTPVLAAFALILIGSAHNSTAAPEKGDSNYRVARNTHAEVYINPDASSGGNAFREVFIAPLNLAQLQIIQPEGATMDQQWQITDLENEMLQNAMVSEFATQLSYESAYNIVNRREDADMVVHTTAVAISPFTTRAEVAAGAKPSGAITISLALINAGTGEVMVRSVDTKSTDNIWAFNQVGNDEAAIDLIFRAWGNSMRRGLLRLQGRSSDPLEEPLQMKE